MQRTIVLLYLVLVLLVRLPSARPGKTADQTADRVPARTHAVPRDICTLSHHTVELEKDVVLPDGRPAVCLGQATLSSCNGECTSFSIPSAKKSVRFRKKCTCCRETQMTPQTVVLSPCFHPHDGQLIPFTEFVDEYKQPSDCACQSCSV